MKAGVRAHDYGRHGVAEYAALLKNEGYEAVQLAIPKAFTGIGGYEDITEALCEEIRREFEAQKLEIAVLGVRRLIRIFPSWKSTAGFRR